MPLDCLGLGTMANQINPSFLLEQADQGDLDMAKERYAYGKYPKFRQAIDEAFKIAPPAGSRIISVEKARLVLMVLAPIINASDSMNQAASSRNIYSERRKRRREARRRGKKRAQRIIQTEKRPSCTHSN